MIEGSGSGPIALTNGSGSRRPKNMWIRWIRIRIRIRNTVAYTRLLAERAGVPKQIIQQHRNSGTLYTSTIITLRAGTLFGAEYEQLSY
jgi:hypothetical protein